MASTNTRKPIPRETPRPLPERAHWHLRCMKLRRYYANAITPLHRQPERAVSATQRPRGAQAHLRDSSAFCILSSSHTGSRGSGEFELPRSRSNSMIGRSSIRKMVHSRRHRQSWGICTPRHIERRNPERCCQRWTPASDARCCKGTL
jgi:hypothetical protein